MQEHKGQTVKIEYPNGQGATLPNQTVTELHQEDGVLFGVVFGQNANIFCATWGDNPDGVWFSTRDQIASK